MPGALHLTTFARLGTLLVFCDAMGIWCVGCANLTGRPGGVDSHSRVCEQLDARSGTISLSLTGLNPHYGTCRAQVPGCVQGGARGRLRRGSAAGDQDAFSSSPRQGGRCGGVLGLHAVAGV